MPRTKRWLTVRRPPMIVETMDVPYREPHETSAPHQLWLPFPDRTVPAIRFA